jgi:hypothetical protein
MTDNDDTMRAPPDEPQTTADADSFTVAGVDPDSFTVARAEHAWSVEDDDDAQTARQYGRAMSVGLVVGMVVLLLAVAVAGIWLAAPLFRSTPVIHVAPQPKPSAVMPPPPVTVTAQPPPPVTITEPPTAAPSKVPTGIETPEQDAWLLTRLKVVMGYNTLASEEPGLVVDVAHQFCRLLRLGESTRQANDDMQAITGWGKLATAQVDSTAQEAYSDCP